MRPTAPLRQARRVRIARLVRYAATSAVAFGVSEATLLVLYGSGAVGATVAALLANLVGTVPSYLMSRYWIWSEAPRTRVGRQVVLYWTTSAAFIAGTSFATGGVARLVPADHPYHLVLVGLGFFVVSVVFWLAKFVVYQRAIFPVPPSGDPTGDPTGDLARTSDTAATAVRPTGPHVGGTGPRG